MNKTIKLAIVFLLLIINIIFSSYAFASSKGEYKKDSYEILIINSNYQGNHWEQLVREGLTKRLNEHKAYEFNIKIEYLEFGDKDDLKYLDSVSYMIDKKYPMGSVDIVYSIGDEAYEFINKKIVNRNSSFYKLPLFFSGVNVYEDNGTEGISPNIGIYNEHDIFELMNLVLKLNPEVENICLIINDLFYTKSITTELIELTSKLLKKNISVTSISSNYIEDISEGLINLSYKPNSINIISGEFKYKESNIYSDPKETINIIKGFSNRPIYSNDNIYLNKGIVGGCIDLGLNQGNLIGGLIIDYLDGIDLSDRFPMNEPKPNIIIDYNSIKEYQLDAQNIDKGTIVINKKFYETLFPKHIEIMLYLVIVIFSVMSIHLFIEHSKKKKIRIIEEEKRKEQEDRENLKTDFIVNLSHELRTPINIIMNTSKVIKMKLENNVIDKESIEETLDMINNNSYRLLKLSNNIIDITSAESGLFKIQLTNKNIIEVVEEAFCSSIKYAKTKNIEMLFDTDEEEIITAIDVIQIQRVVLNLLSNAIKFTDYGGHILLSIKRIGDNVEIKVIDTGIGIPKDKLKEIFYRFYQVDYSTTRCNEGSGIGLCIVKDIVEIHNGDIEVESDVGLGSIFKVYIPIKKIERLEEENKFIEYDVSTIANVEMADIIR